MQGPMGHVERPQSEPSGNDCLGFLGEQLAHQIEDRAVKDDKAGLERFQTDGLDQMAFSDHAAPGMIGKSQSPASVRCSGP
jgi:hypothetical protein